MSKSKKTSKKISLGDFQKMTSATITSSTAISAPSSWADEMDDEEVYSTPSSTTTGSTTNAAPTSSGNDLRSMINQQQHNHSNNTYRKQYDSFEEKRFESSRPPIDESDLPTEAPFVLFIKNLPFQTTRDDVADFFEQLPDVRVENVILPMDREREGRIKGIGYVEFADLQSLKSALTLNGRDFMRRNIFIDLTQPETAQKMSIMNRSSSHSGASGARANREPTIADQADSWRGGEGGDRPNIFGRSSSNRRSHYRDDDEDRPPRREREPQGPSFEEKFALQRQKKLEQRSGHSGPRRTGGPRRQQHNNEIDENDPLYLATMSQSERPKLQLKERTVQDSSNKTSASGSSSIFGEGKAWEETEKLRDHVEKLAVSEKRNIPKSSTLSADDDGFEKMVDKKSTKKKSMDFSNFNKRGADRKSEQSTSSTSTTTTTAATTEKKQESGKKQDKPKSDNAWAALASVDE